jgi:hypothetical protein
VEIGAKRGDRTRHPFLEDEARQRVMGDGAERVHKVQLASMDQGADVDESQ